MHCRFQTFYQEASTAYFVHGPVYGGNSVVFSQTKVVWSTVDGDVFKLWPGGCIGRICLEIVDCVGV